MIIVSVSMNDYHLSDVMLADFLYPGAGMTATGRFPGFPV